MTRTSSRLRPPAGAPSFPLRIAVVALITGLALPVPVWAQRTTVAVPGRVADAAVIVAFVSLRSGPVQSDSSRVALVETGSELGTTLVRSDLDTFPVSRTLDKWLTVAPCADGRDSLPFATPVEGLPPLRVVLGV